MKSLSSRSDLEVICKIKLNSALGWADRERRREGVRGEGRSFWMLHNQGWEDLLFFKTAYQSPLNCPWRQVKNHFSARNFPAFLLPPKGKWQSWAEAPRDWSWEERSICALCALKGASRAWLMGSHSCLATSSSGALGKGLNLFVPVFSSVINIKIMIPPSSGF